ncbi:MAG: hypothetical protein GY927_03125 [bacterium]|nr:hypothetical protein [bacterium]
MASDDSKSRADIAAELSALWIEADRLFDDFSIDKYVYLRRRYPIYEIAPGSFHNTDMLFEIADELKQYGIDPRLLAAALDGKAKAIDELCLHIMEDLIERESMIAPGKTHLQSRKITMPDSLINTLIQMISESCLTQHVHPTGSFYMLVTKMLGGANSKRHKKTVTKQKQVAAASLITRKPELSTRQVAEMISVDHTTVSRWLKDDYLQHLIEIFKHGPLQVEGFPKKNTKPAITPARFLCALFLLKPSSFIGELFEQLGGVSKDLNQFRCDPDYDYVMLEVRKYLKGEDSACLDEETATVEVYARFEDGGV